MRLRIPALFALLLLPGCERAAPALPGEPAADSVAAPAPAVTPGQAGDSAAALAAELRGSLEALLRGEPAPAAADTSASWFSAATADRLRSVSVDSAGHAIVEFEDLRTVIPSASSSAGSSLLLRQLNAVVFAVDGVRSVEYRMAGSCDVFWEWLQYGCQVVTPADTASWR